MFQHLPSLKSFHPSSSQAIQIQREAWRKSRVSVLVLDGIAGCETRLGASLRSDNVNDYPR